MKALLLLALLSSPWFQYANVSDAGFDAKALADARAFADQSKSAAVVAVADGHVIAAWGAIDRKLELHSVRKSLYAALWGIAEARGLVDVNATLADLGVDDLQKLTAEEKSARLVDLLHARSGVYHPSAYAPTDMEEKLPARGSHAPNTFWYYNNWDFNVAGALLEKMTGKPLGVLFDEWIAKPLAMEDYTPADVFAVREPNVSKWPALTLRMSARDLARFGQMWLDDGRWEGKQIVPKAWIARASESASAAFGPGQGYAMMWWVYDAGSVDAEKYPHASKVRVLMARGTGGQVIAVIPEEHMVIVHRADTDNGVAVRGPVVWSLIDRILGARRGATTASVRVEPFASQSPAFTWPKSIALTAAQQNAVLGNYELQPGVVARVFLSDGQLFASMPGRGEAELFAISPSEFFVRVDPGTRVHFDATGVTVNMGGREIRGVRASPVH